MTIPWPQEVVWPTELHEHATQLTKHLRNALLYLESEQATPVPPDQVKAIITTMLPLIAKTQRTPDMTTIHDQLRIIHTEMTQDTKETVKEIAEVKGELKALRKDTQKNITVGEEAKTAAKEATEVGKTVAGIASDIKNKGTQFQTGIPMSYAAAAARGGLATSTYSVQAQSVKTPAMVRREIIVNIRNAQTIQNLRAMNPRNLKAHVDRAISQSENEHIANLKIMSANQLKSGDLSIRTATNGEMQLLRQFTEDWTPRIGNGTSVRNPTYGVLVHGIRTSTMNT